MKDEWVINDEGNNVLLTNVTKQVSVKMDHSGSIINFNDVCKRFGLSAMDEDRITVIDAINYAPENEDFTTFIFEANNTYLTKPLQNEIARMRDEETDDSWIYERIQELPKEVREFVEVYVPYMVSTKPDVNGAQVVVPAVGNITTDAGEVKNVVEWFIKVYDAQVKYIYENLSYDDELVEEYIDWYNKGVGIGDLFNFVTDEYVENRIDDVELLREGLVKCVSDVEDYDTLSDNVKGIHGDLVKKLLH